jgi:hypothetical protein
VKDFLKEAPYAPHATTHGTVGGNFGCDLLVELVEQGVLLEEQKGHVCAFWIVFLKESYRGNYITPKKDCEVITTSDDGLEAADVEVQVEDEYTGVGSRRRKLSSSASSSSSILLTSDNQDCGFVCNEDRMELFRDHILLQLTTKGFASGDMLPVNSTANATVDAWVDFVCQGNAFKIFGGDHFESASPADPSFCPIHPTLERVLHLKYLTGGFADNDVWPAVKYSLDGREYICNKQSHCFDEASGEYGAWDACCYGHYPDDQLLDAPNNNRSAGYGLTNRELFTGINAASGDYSMTYIYDHFEWPHCADTQGGDISAFAKELYAAMQAYMKLSPTAKESSRPPVSA